MLNYHENVCLQQLDPQHHEATRLLYVFGHLFAILLAGVLNDDFDYTTEDPWRVFWRAVTVYTNYDDLRVSLAAATTKNNCAPLREFVRSFHGVRADRV